MENLRGTRRTSKLSGRENGYDQEVVGPPVSIKLIEVQTDCEIRNRDSRTKSAVVVSVLGVFFAALLFASVYGMISGSFVGLEKVSSYGGPIILIIIGSYFGPYFGSHKAHSNDEYKQRNHQQWSEDE